MSKKVLTHPIILAFVTILLTLALEYWLFIPLLQVDEVTPFTVSDISAILLVSLASLISAFWLLYSFNLLWLTPHDHIREDFALVGVATSSALTLLLLSSFFFGLMPWDIVWLLGQRLLNRPLPPPQTPPEAYVLLLMLYGAIIFAIRNGHRQWPGLKSVEQQQREQQNEPFGLIKEAESEIKRIIQRQPPLKIHSDRDLLDYVTPLKTIQDSLAWKDQAKALILLSSSAYIFEATGWHDQAGYWLGKNINTGDLVFLYPAHSTPPKADLDEFISYTRRIAKQQKCKIGERILAVKAAEATPVTHCKNQPIRFEQEHTLLAALVDFKDYKNEIRKRVLSNTLPESPLTLHDTYVSPRFWLDESKKQSADLVSYLHDWLAEAGQRQLTLLGEYGQGKSTAALLLSHALLSHAETPEADPKEPPSRPNPAPRIPILIELRGMSPRNLTPLQLLGAWAAQYRLEPQALLRLLVAGRLLLIFEGFDEMALVGDREMRLKHFETLWQFCYPQAKILITGRPNFFLDEEELKAALGISKPVSQQPYCEALHLAPFNPNQIRESLRAQPALVREQISTFASQNPRFAALVERPSLLHIVSALWKRDQLADKVKQLNSAYVMDLFVRHSYRRQGLKESDSPGFMALTGAEREFFMQGIACYMAAKRLPNQLTANQLNEVISALIEAIPEAISERKRTSTITHESRQPLRLRLDGTEYGLEHVQTDVRACGLLVDDPTSPGTFRFGHKSFMEYLFAAVLAQQITTDLPLQARSILQVTEASLADIFSLPVSVEFLAELIITAIQPQLNQNSIAAAEAQLDKEYRVALRLLKDISWQDVALERLQSLILFDVVFALSSKPYGRRKEMPLSLGINLFLFLPSFVFVFIYLTLSLLSSSPPLPLLSLLLSSLSIFLSFLSLSILFYLSFSTLSLSAITRLEIRNIRSSKGETTPKSRLGLWNYICKTIGIQDQVLHRVAGSRLLPWAKDKPFDYFLPKPADNE